MDFAAVLTVVILLACLSTLIFSRLPTDLVMFSAVCLLLLGGVLTAEEALQGFANEGVATVAILFIVAHALNTTGAVGWLSQGLLGKPQSLRMAQARLMVPVAVLSSVLNNTPVVAMMVPVVSDWARRMQMPASQLMMPLSFAAIIGGICTLIGTSTNLVVNGMLKQVAQDTPLRLFDLAWVGVPCVVAVIGFVVLFGRYLLPNRKGADQRFADARQYSVEMIVDPSGPMVGKSIEEAGLRHLPGLYLADIYRQGEMIPAVGPRQRLFADDRLVFVGNVDSVVDLKRVRGLLPADNQVFKLGQDTDRSLVEVVISRDFPLLRRTVKEGNFRNYYNAVIIAMTRNGQQIKSRIGDIVLLPGDTLLLETRPEFVNKQRYAKDFLVVSPVAEFQPVRSRRQWVALGILVAMVALASAGVFSMLEAALLASAAYVLAGCVSLRNVRKAISWDVLMTIATSLALGEALQKTGVAGALAETLLSSTAGSGFATLAAVFFVTALLSAFISNVAAAVLVFPIAVAAATGLGLNLIPFAVVIMVAASASFATPIGYQTNLMVYGPGDYRFADFFRLGIPLTVLVGVVTLLIVPLVWPLQ